MKRTLLLCLLLAYSLTGYSQYTLYDSAIQYRMTPSFNVAMDTLIAQAVANPADTGEDNPATALLRYENFMGSRISLDVAPGADMTAPMSVALSSYMAYFSGPCTGGSYTGNWTCLGPFTNYYGPNVTQQQGRIVSLWVSPLDSNTILAGADGGGLWKSNNDGHSWHNITDGNSGNSVLGMPGVYGIAVDPLDTNIIYISLNADGQYEKNGGYQLGLAYTTDGGSTWNEDTAFADTAGGLTTGVTQMAYMPGTQKLFALTEYNGIFYKGYPADTWHNITPSAMLYGSPSAWGLGFSNLNPGKVIVTTTAISYPGNWADTSSMWICDTTSLTTWAQMKMPIAHCTQSYRNGGYGWNEVIQLSMSSADTAYITIPVYDSAISANTTLLVKTPITSFTPTILNTNFGSNVSAFAISQGNQSVVYTANYSSSGIGGIFTQSTNSGGTFHEISYYDHSDGRCLYVWKSYNDPDSDVVYFGCDGGVSKKRMLATHTQSITGDSLAITQFYGFGNTEADENIMTGGTQDDGGFAYIKTNTPPWTNIWGGDGYNSKFMNNGVNKAFGEYNNCSGCYPFLMYEADFTASSASGNSLSTPPDSPYSNINRPIYFAPNNTGYVGYSYIWKMPFGSSTWQRAFAADPINVGPYVFQKEVADFYINEQDSNYAYIVYKGTGPNPSVDTFGGLYFTSNAYPPIGSGILPFWINRTPSIVSTNNINSIAVDPNNFGRIWVAFGNVNSAYVGANPDTMKYRVWHSEDTGQTWTDVSAGLPALSVNKLLYRKGSNDEIFAGTDVGVFEWNPATSSWQCFNTGLPTCIVMDMEMNYCAGKLRVATYGRGIWETPVDIPWNIVVSGDTITTSTNWTTNHYVTGAIVVDSGVALNFTDDTVFMPRNAAIIVRPGGRLILNHAVVTNECDACMWYGIEAYGNNRLPQNPTNQAWVQIDSGSVVANARYAVTNGDIWDDSAFGGIIQGYQSSFVDNHVDASFYPYFNTTSPGVVAPDLSYFENCTFSTDNNYKPDALYPFAHHVYMYGVQGIFFTGCQFSNRNDLGSTRGFGEGIMATDAGFSTGVYCPEPYYSLSGCPTPVRTRFSGFATGIDIEDVGGAALTISIDQTDFDTISTGISVATENNVSVTRCNFKVGNGNGVLDVSSMDSTGCEQNIGVLIQNADQFRMEQNTFTGIPIGGGWYNFGAVVANSDANGTQSNMVYRNTFDSLTEGVYAIGCNATGSGTPGSVLATGLEILCNAFSNNTNDIYVANDGNNYGPTHPQGIAKTQEGYSPYYGYVPTENTFTGSTYNIVNNGQVFTYYYDTTGGNQFPTYTGTDTVARYFMPPYSLMCQSTIPAGFSGAAPVAVNPPVLRSYQQAYRNAKAELSDSLTAYNSRIDFGNTTELVSTINASRYGILLYALLAVESPWLSETALDAAADMKLMSYSEFVSILKLNASVFRDPDFRAYIAADYTLTTDDMNTLVSLSAGTNRRTNLESAIMNASLTASIDANTIMMALKVATDTNVSVTDTTGAGICTDPTNVYYGLDSNSYYAGADSIDTWLQNIGDLWTWYARVGLYNYVHSYTIADSIFTAMGAIVPDNKADQSTYNEYAAIGSVLLPAEIAGRNITQLDSSDIAALDTTSLPFIGYNTAELVLRNITANINLVRTGVLQAPYEVPCMSAGGLSTFRKGNSGDTPITASPITAANSNNANSRFEAYPNPASGIVTFAYYVPDPGENITILITNILGEKVQVLYTGNSMGTVYWDSSRQPTGVYLYQASDTNGLVSMGKVVIAR